MYVCMYVCMYICMYVCIKLGLPDPASMKDTLILWLHPENCTSQSACLVVPLISTTLTGPPRCTCVCMYASMYSSLCICMYVCNYNPPPQPLRDPYIKGHPSKQNPEILLAIP